MSSMQQESTDIQLNIEEIFELEELTQEEFLPEPPVESDEPVFLLPPATFGPNVLTLTYENVKLHAIQLIEAHFEKNRFEVKTIPSDFLDRILHRNATPDSLWSFIKIGETPMKVGNVDFRRAFQFSDQTSSDSSVLWSTGMRQLYVCCFTLSVSILKDIIGYWEDSDYFPSEIDGWIEQCEDEDDNKLVYIRYVGQCIYPTRPWDRFMDDAAAISKSFFTNFAEARVTLHPQVYRAAQVLL
ncbi:hypothetical protein VKS41_000742 [Umbelopsis sp. WA50703]